MILTNQAASTPTNYYPPFTVTVTVTPPTPPESRVQWQFQIGNDTPQTHCQIDLGGTGIFTVILSPSTPTYSFNESYIPYVINDTGQLNFQLVVPDAPATPYYNVTVNSLLTSTIEFILFVVDQQGMVHASPDPTADPAGDPDCC